MRKATKKSRAVKPAPASPMAQLDLFSDLAPRVQRPTIRGECAQVPRPCPFVGCRYNMNIDVLSTGGLRWRQPEEWQIGTRDNCALDVAEKGPFTLDEIGKVMGVSRERIRQEINEAFRKLRDCLPDPMYSDLLEHVDADDFD